MGRRTVLLAASLAVAALGTILVFLYVRSITAGVAEGQEQLEVLVANQRIDAGTTGAQAQEAGALELRRIPRDYVAENAISAVNPIENFAALGPIFPGEQIVTDKFGPTVARSAIPIPDGLLALSVQLSDPARVAGFVRPTSRVAVFYTTSGTADKPASTSVLLENVAVIGAGSSTVVTQTTTTTTGTTREQIPQAILTLAVTQAQAQRLVLAQSLGDLYLGLLREDSAVAAGSQVTADNLVRP